MAIGKYEQKLIDASLGKMIMSNESYRIIVEANKYGVIKVSDMIFSIFPYLRENESYIKQFDGIVIDDIIDEFEKSDNIITTGNYLKMSYYELYNYQNKISFVLSQFGNIKLVNRQDFEIKDATKEEKQEFLTNSLTTKDAVDMFQNCLKSKSSALNELKRSIGYKKDNLLSSTRDTYTSLLANIKLDTVYEEDEKKFELIKIFYEKLRATLSQEELENENNLLEKSYKEKITLKQEKQTNRIKYLKEGLQESRKNQLEYLSQIDTYQDFEEKPCIRENDIFNGIVYPLYTCNYGYAYINNLGLCLETSSQSKLKDQEIKKWHSIENEFSQLNAIGERYKSRYSGTCTILLYSNDDYCIYIADSKDENPLLSISCTTKKHFFDSYFKNDNAVNDTQLDDQTLQQLTSFNYFIYTLKENLKKKYNTASIIEKLKEQLIKDKMRELGFIIDIDNLNDYDKQQYKLLTQSFVSEYLTQYCQNDEIENFYKELNQEIEKSIKTYSQNKNHKQTFDEQALEEKAKTIYNKNFEQEIYHKNEL